MSDLFSSFTSFLSNIIQHVTGWNYTPSQQYVFSPADYHPIYGNPGKVNKPGVNLATKYYTPPKHIENVLPFGQKILNSSMYQEAYFQRKQDGFNRPNYILDPDLRTRPIHGKELRFIDGTTIHSRDPYRKVRSTQFYDKVSEEKDLF